MSKKFIILFVLLSLSFLGMLSCTTSGIAGLAKEEYVNTTFAEHEAKQAADLEEIKEKIRELSREIKDMQEFLEGFEDLANMQDLANDVQARLEQMPEETLLKLFEILKAYLDQK